MTSTLDYSNDAPIVVDISALQSPDSRGRGIGRYALSWCIALESERPDLVSAYCLNAQLAPPGALAELTNSNKVTYTTPQRLASARIVHQLAPFDLTQSATTLHLRRSPSQLASATVYDLIPARDLNRELISAVARRRYRTRLELVRSLDHLQVLSDCVAEELTSLLGIDHARISCVGAAPDPAFMPPSSRDLATSLAVDHLSDNGLARSYVLYPSGSHPRKNNERLIEAWARVRVDLRQRHQLVIVGAFDAPTINHFHHLAESLGISDGIVIPGFVSDRQLVELYQGASLVCFASLGEGYGLPIVEAIACETPVIASAIAPHDELLGADALFDPTNPETIATAISQALDQPLSPVSITIQRWSDVGRASGEDFDRLLARSARTTRHALRRRRRRVGVVSPLPPAPSGIARYSYRLIEAMAATEKVELTCFSDGPTDGQIAPRGLELHPVEALRHIEYLTGRFDDVIYVVGNSHHHLGALAMARQRRGLVLSHEVRLSNLYRHANGDPGLLPGGLARDIQRIYQGQLPPYLGLDGELSEQDLEKFGLLMAREMIAISTGFLVTSTSAAELARIDAGTAYSRQINTIPFAMEAPEEREIGFRDDVVSRPSSLTNVIADFWGAGPVDGRLDTKMSYIGHFGIVDGAKGPELLIGAFAELGANDDLRLIFVGPIADTLTAQLIEQATILGVADRVGFTGPLAPPDYRAWLDRVTLAVQLRTTTNGEASAAVGECLACGVPTIVSDLGWTGELPESIVFHVPKRSTTQQLAAAIARVINDTTLRRSLSEAGSIYARQNNFDYAARSLLHLLETRWALL